MATTREIALALVSAGYLTETNRQAAQPILAASLDDELLSRRAQALQDEDKQEQTIEAARQYAEKDAASGDKRELAVDNSIIRDSIDKAEVDEATRRHADQKIAAACKEAAKGLAHARLIEKSNEKVVAELIQKTWTGNPA